MAARLLDHRGRRVGAWLGIVIMAGCAKGTEATRASPAQATPTAAVSAPRVSEASPQAPHQGALEPEAAPPANPARLTLLVSNQSSTVPEVDIQVRIDGRPVVDDTFALGSGHTSKRYELQLSKGAHELRATAHHGAATYEGSIDMQGERWGALLFWRSPKEGARASEQEPAFTFDLQDSPIRLR
jgi:hypothetical protein